MTSPARIESQGMVAHRMRAQSNAPALQSHSSVQDEIRHAKDAERRRRHQAVEGFYAEQLKLLHEQVGCRSGACFYVVLVL